MSHIYALYWENSGTVYIGQTITDKRIKNHLSAMRSGTHTNYKIQRQYNEEGEPTYVILEKCLEDSLNLAELNWIREFNALEEGLNISDGTTVGRGVTAPNSKYSKKTVLKIFSMLYRDALSYSKIEKRLNLKQGMPEKIASGTSHTWLREQYPEKYDLMVRNRLLRLDVNRDRRGFTINVYKDIVDPNGVIHSVSSTILNFCKEHPLLEEKNRNAISELLSGVIPQYKGFRVYTPETPNNTSFKKNPPIKDPEGIIHHIDIGKVAKFCRENPTLQLVPKANIGISAVLRGISKSYHGFRLA